MSRTKPKKTATTKRRRSPTWQAEDAVLRERFPAAFILPDYIDGLARTHAIPADEIWKRLPSPLHVLGIARKLGGAHAAS